MKVVSIHDLCAVGVLVCGLVLGGCEDENTASPWTAQLGVTRGSMPVAGSAPAAAGMLGGPAAPSIGDAVGGVSGAAAVRVVADSGTAGRIATGSASIASASIASAGTGAARLPVAGASGSVSAAGSSARAGSGGASGSASLPEQSAQAGSGGDSAAGPTFATVFSLLKSDCNACHDQSAGGVNTMTLDSAYASLVNAEAKACQGLKRVEPGKPVRSVLYLAITGIGAGDCNPLVMPLGAASGWDESKTDVIRDWILAGAKR